MNLSKHFHKLSAKVKELRGQGMTLGQKQRHFTRMIGLLIEYAYQEGCASLAMRIDSHDCMVMLA